MYGSQGRVQSHGKISQFMFCYKNIQKATFPFPSLSLTPFGSVTSAKLIT